LLKVDPPLHCGRVLVPFFDLVPEAGDFSVFQVAADQGGLAASPGPGYPDHRLPAQPIQGFGKPLPRVNFRQIGMGDLSKLAPFHPSFSCKREKAARGMNPQITIKRQKGTFSRMAKQILLKRTGGVNSIVKDFEALKVFNSIQTRGAKGECKQAILKSRTHMVNGIHSRRLKLGKLHIMS